MKHLNGWEELPSQATPYGFLLFRMLLNSDISCFLRIILMSQNQENHMVPQQTLQSERRIYYGFGKESSKGNQENCHKNLSAFKGLRKDGTPLPLQNKRNLRFPFVAKSWYNKESDFSLCLGRPNCHERETI